MSESSKPTAPKKAKAKARPRGRPETRVIKLNASPERVARAMFSAVKPPDPSLRKPMGTRRAKTT
ncbi:MAG: hypothetical protein OXG16_07335 [Rhodospirillales bacterium]|nr:hypothetical protein [Rhodospirillales bacterium]